MVVRQGESTLLNKTTPSIQLWNRWAPPAKGMKRLSLTPQDGYLSENGIKASWCVWLCLRPFLVHIQNYIFIDFKDASERTTRVLAIPMEMPHIFSVSIVLLSPAEVMGWNRKFSRCGCPSAPHPVAVQPSKDEGLSLLVRMTKFSHLSFFPNGFLSPFFSFLL